MNSSVFFSVSKSQRRIKFHVKTVELNNYFDKKYESLHHAENTVKNTIFVLTMGTGACL